MSNLYCEIKILNLSELHNRLFILSNWALIFGQLFRRMAHYPQWSNFNVLKNPSIVWFICAIQMGSTISSTVLSWCDRVFLRYLYNSSPINYRFFTEIHRFLFILIPTVGLLLNYIVYKFHMNAHILRNTFFIDFLIVVYVFICIFKF